MTPPPPAVAAAGAPAVRPRRTPPAPARRPRRVSGPARPRRAVSPDTVAAPRAALDRLIHGRAWIGVVTFALIGIVTMQLGLLKLNAGIGRALEHEGALQRENSALSVENSEIAAGDTVELQAAHMGMQLVPAGSLKFLTASPAYVDRAVSALNRPATPPPPPMETESSESTAASSETTSETTSEAKPETKPETTASAAPAETTESTSTPATTSESTPTSESGGASAGPGG